MHVRRTTWPHTPAACAGGQRRPFSTRMPPLRAWVARTMNLHEYQAKDVFRSYGIPVPAGEVVRTPEEAVEAARALGGNVWVVKAQVHAGGRGKAGGVKLAREIDTVRTAAERMLGKRLVTQQTGPEGLPVSHGYIESGSDIARELYLSLTLNRERGRIALIASSA